MVHSLLQATDLEHSLGNTSTSELLESFLVLFQLELFHSQFVKTQVPGSEEVDHQAEDLMGVVTIMGYVASGVLVFFFSADKCAKCHG